VGITYKLGINAPEGEEGGSIIIRVRDVDSAGAGDVD